MFLNYYYLFLEWLLYIHQIAAKAKCLWSQVFTMCLSPPNINIKIQTHILFYFNITHYKSLSWMVGTWKATHYSCFQLAMQWTYFISSTQLIDVLLCFATSKNVKHKTKPQPIGTHKGNQMWNAYWTICFNYRELSQLEIYIDTRGNHQNQRPVNLRLRK